MGYTALYRKFRPQTFSEMVGQEHITRTLRNQIIANRVGHAYLFNGVRGTGKTTSAKVLARAVNCLNPQDGAPCNECEICKAALDGSLTDIVEMDAASNNSVEDVRAIRDEVNFLPTIAKYRVYIIDEVHMLSTGAFNALLKTLEEPPEHVKFILATTEPQKLPATILSRCQRFDFKRISVEDIIKRLKVICKESEIQITEEAVKMIATLAEGALRDGISILERCSQDTEGIIDENKIRDLVGMPRLELIKGLVKSIIDKEPEKAIEITNTIIREGKDLDNLLWEIIKYVKDTLIYKTTQELDLYSKEDIEFIKELSSKPTKERLLNLIYKLSDLANNMKASTQKNIIFQIGIIKECMELEARSENLELKNQEAKVAEKKTIQRQESKPAQVKQETPKAEETIQKVKSSGKYVPYWKEVLDKIKENGKMTMYANLIGTKGVLLNDLVIGIEFPGKVTDFAKKTIEDNENKALMEKIISMKQGTSMQIKILEKTKNPESIKKEGIEGFAEEQDLPFNIIDE